jgi:hypothetical protein
VLRVDQHATAEVRHGQRDVLEGRHERELAGGGSESADDQLALRRRICTHRASTHKPAHRAVKQDSDSTSSGRAAR